MMAMVQRATSTTTMTMASVRQDMTTTTMATDFVSSQKHRNQYQRQKQLKVSANFAASQFLQPLTEDSSHFHFCSFSQDLLSASCDLVLQATYGDVSSQRHSTSSNHSTTNIIKTPLLIMVNTI
jgi:hypothetical protein